MIDIKKNNFDLLRLIAAIQVVIVHSYSHVLVKFGYKDENINFVISLLAYIPGVPIFFLLSGFLISMSYEKNSNLKDYVTNRVLRIYPALYVNIFIGVLILYYFGFAKFNLEFFSWLIAQMTIFQFYNAEMFREFGLGVINGSLWTISVELTFYIILPFLFFLYKKSKINLIILLLLAFIVSFYDTESSKSIFYNKLLHVSILPYVFWFITGFFFFKFLDKIKIFIMDKFFLWFCIFIIYNFVINAYGIEWSYICILLKWLVFSLMVFSFAFSFREQSGKLLRGNDYTYGIYIYHAFAINIFVHIGLVSELKYLGYILLMSILFGVISWHIVEKPFLRLKKHSIFSELHKEKGK